MRLQKIIATAGVASRRRAELLIRSGMVTVNGSVVRELGRRADPQTDKIRVEGKLIKKFPPKIYLILNKPGGCITSLSDDKGRQTVMSLLENVKERVYPVGRLDYDVEGLLLFTNDGELANAIAHPSNGVVKTYLVKVKGKPNESVIRKMCGKIILEDGSRPEAEVRIDKLLKRNSWLEIKVHEGKKHMVKNICETAGYQPLKVIRTKIAFLDLEGLSPGRYRHLNQVEITALKTITGLVK